MASDPLPSKATTLQLPNRATTGVPVTRTLLSIANTNVAVRRQQLVVITVAGRDLLAADTASTTAIGIMVSSNPDPRLAVLDRAKNDHTSTIATAHTSPAAIRRSRDGNPVDVPLLETGTGLGECARASGRTAAWACLVPRCRAAERRTQSTTATIRQKARSTVVGANNIAWMAWLGRAVHQPSESTELEVP